MADFNNSPNMSLPVPAVGVAPGPDWATLLNSCLTILDGHSHVAGSGVPITPNALNINADLPMGGNNLTAARSARFSPQGSPLALASDLGCIYVSGVDLFYNDGNGNQIQITQSGAVAGTPGSIANLVSPASATYVAGQSTFVWQSAANTPANMDLAALVLRNLSAGSNSLTLQPPAAMGSNTTITLPTLPVAAKVLSLDASGNLATGVVNTVVTTDITDQNVTTAKIEDEAVTQAKLAPRPVNNPAAAGEVAISASSGMFMTASGSFTPVTNLSITLTTLGRPVYISLVSANTTVNGQGYVGLAGGVGTNAVTFAIFRDGVEVCSSSVLGVGSQTGVPPGTMAHLDAGLAAGTYVYTIQAASNAGSTAVVSHCKLLAYEI
jgi:hypothetical protein